MAENAIRVDRHRHAATPGTILGALMLREMTTRFGRENIGFLWIVFEPLLFAFGVMGLWFLIKPPYEHGIRLAPIVMTSYVPMLLLRHCMNRSVLVSSSNSGLLYHRQIKLMHLIIARLGLEVVSLTITFGTVYAVLLALGQVGLPENPGLLVAGWILSAVFAFGLGLVICTLSEASEVVERVIGLTTYIMIPICGAWFMVDWLPSSAQSIALAMPTVHGFEMIREGVFGDHHRFFYDPMYLLYWGLALNFVGLLGIQIASRNIEVE